MYEEKNAAMKIFIGTKEKKTNDQVLETQAGVTATTPQGMQTARSCFQCQQRSESQAVSRGQQLISGSIAS